MNTNKQDKPKRSKKQMFLHATTVVIAIITCVTLFAGFAVNMF